MDGNAMDEDSTNIREAAVGRNIAGNRINDMTVVAKKFSRTVLFAVGIVGIIVCDEIFDNKASAVINDILTSEPVSLLWISGSIAFVGWGAWPILRTAWRYPYWKCLDRNRTQALALIDEFLSRLNEASRKRQGPMGEDFKTLPLRRCMTRLFKEVNEPPDEESMRRVLHLVRRLDDLGLLPGEKPPIGAGLHALPEHDGLDLDWDTELKRIRDYLDKHSLRATRAKVREWYGHLELTPYNGSRPAVFRYRNTYEAIEAGEGRAEHDREVT